MRRSLFTLIILLATTLLCAQDQNQGTTQGIARPPAQQREHSSITGCLTSGKHGDFTLVDQQGHANVVYSSTVHLNSYVGQSVTLVGDQDASQGTDTGTGRSMRQFKVFEVRPASGNCK